MRGLSKHTSSALLELGVRTRIQQLEEELSQLHRFVSVKRTSASSKTPRRKMSSAQRKAVSVRMKALWKTKQKLQKERHA